MTGDMVVLLYQGIVREQGEKGWFETRAVTFGEQGSVGWKKKA
jgi:hypothetical protein